MQRSSSYAFLAASSVVLGACSSSASLTVQITSDLVPTREIDAVSLSITSDVGYTHDETITLDAGASLGRPRRLAALSALPPGTYEVDVVAHQGGSTVVARHVRVPVHGDVIRTVMLTGDCRTASCALGQTCAGGRCVVPECTDETPEACGTPECASDADCTGGSVACAPRRCTATGACERVPDDAACGGATPVCDTRLGCIAVASGDPLDLTATARAGARSVLVDATTTDATEVYVGISATPLPGTPGVAEVRSLGSCAVIGRGVHCRYDSAAPDTLYYWYAIATRSSASGTVTSALRSGTVTTTPETTTRTFTSGGVARESLIWVPDDVAFAAPGETFPTLLFLHGGTETTDSLSALLTGDSFIPTLLADRAFARAFPFIVVAPHCATSSDPTCNPSMGGWDNAVPIDALDDAVAALPIDPRRVYVSGWSMGGEGAWRVATAIPDRIAAILPVGTCGFGAWPPAGLCGMSGVPVWAFDGAMDHVCGHDNGLDQIVPPLDACPGTPAPRQIDYVPCTTTTDTTNHCGYVEVYGGTHGASFEGHASVFDWLLSHTHP